MDRGSLGGCSPWHGSQIVGGGDETKKLMGIRLLEICRPLLGVWGFPGGSDGKVSACNAGDQIPWRRKWQPTPVKSHGRRSLVGYSPWARKESDMTEAT